MNFRRIVLLRPLAILAVSGLVAYLMISSRSPLEARPSSQPPPLVEVQVIQRQSLPITVIAYGNVAAGRELALVAQVTGRVLWQSPSFEPGVRVRSGETLLRVDPTDYQVALAEAKQALASAELSLADATALGQAARIREAEAALAAAQSRITRANRDLANTEVTAPYDAVIDTQQVELGQFVSVGTQLGRILGSEQAEIRLPVTPQDIELIDADSRATVVLRNPLGASPQRWEGRIARVEARIDNATRVHPVVVTVDDPLDVQRHDAPLPFGMFLRAELPGMRIAEAVRIPLSALHGDNDVFLYADGKLKRRQVTVKRQNEGLALVTSGLENGDQVVVTRLDLMFDGLPVALIDE